MNHDQTVTPGPDSVDLGFWARFCGAGLADKLGPPLMHLGRLLERRLEQAAGAAGIGLTPAQARIIIVVHLHGPMSQQTLAIKTDVDPSTLVSTLDVMEREELARREPNPNDRRAYLVYLTEKGEARVPKILALWDDVEPELAGGFTDAERLELVQKLHGLIGRLSKGGASCG